MRKSFFKRPSFYVPAGLFALLAVLSAIVFNPGFQKKQLLARLGPQVESLDIGRVHVTPWSTELEDVTVGYAGGLFHVDSGNVRYSLWSLILKKINIKLLSLQGVHADLSDFDPPESAPDPNEAETPDAPFPGVLAALDRGFGYILDQIEVDADVRLSAGRSVEATLSGGGIRPDTAGTLGLDLRYAVGDDHVDVEGGVRFDQLTDGRFSAIETTLAIAAALDSLPRPEQLAVRLLLQPASGEAEGLAAPGPGEEARFTPEAMELSVSLNDEQAAMRAATEFTGVYDGNGGDLAGDYRLLANERLLQPYAADTVLAPLNETLSGRLTFNLPQLAGDMTINSELLVTDLQATYASSDLPERLRVQNEFRVALLPDRRLRVDRLDTAVGHGAELQALTANLAADQDIPLDDVDAFLRQDNTLLAFDVPAVPLAWLNFILPGYEITQGLLTGGFALVTDTAGAIHLRPQRPLTVTGLNVARAGEPLLQSIDISLSPTLSYSDESLGLALQQIEVTIDGQPLATAAATARLPLSTARSGRLTASSSARLNLRRLTRILGTDAVGAPTLPETIDLTFEADVARQDDGTQLDRLDAELLTDRRDRLVHLALLQPLVMQDTTQGSKIVTPAGPLATFNVSDVDLGWFSAFVPGGSLEGALRQANFALSVDADGTIDIQPDQPFRIDGVTLSAGQEPLLEDVGIRISPIIGIGNERVAVRYEDFELASDGVVLVSGRGTAGIARGAGGTMAAEGRLDADLQGLARQPLVARLLGAGLAAPVRVESDYQFELDGDAIDIERLAANLFYDGPEPKIALRAESGIRVRTRLAAGAPAAGQARGELTLSVANLTAQPFADILATYGLTFGAANGSAVLSSDGTTMRMVTDGPFEISAIEARNADGPLLEPFSVTLDTRVDVQGETLRATLENYRVTFPGSASTAAITGQTDLELDGSGETVWLSSLNSELTVALPALLRQPALMPGNKLTSGRLHSRLALAPDGRVDSTLVLDELKARGALPLQSIRAAVGGTLRRDGSFALSAPVTMTGKTGVDDLQIEATRGSVADGGDLAILVSGDALYWNDVVNTLNAIAGRPPATGAGAEAAAAASDAPAEDNRQADAAPFWSPAGSGVRLGVDIERLFYTDYLAIEDLTARIAILPAQIAVENLGARFHDSPLTMNATLNFTPGPAPYDLTLAGRIDQLDLATLFRELAPDSKPRAEGLFDFRMDAFGQSPNMAQYRNELYFNMLVQSSNGIFRLLDPDSAIVDGSTKFTGAVGELVSYVPTGLFGLGAVPRLVRYIKDVEYDTVRVELVRDESRDVQVRQFVVQSPEVLLTASGGVAYREGVDILHSPLSLDAQLDMRGEGAAIMYDMDLLQSGVNRWNYWNGPAIRFWGTPAVMQSNLSEVISQAGKGMVVGGISRPISGLIGNARHRWSSEKAPAIEYDGDPAEGLPDAEQPRDADEAADLPEPLVQGRE